MGMPRPDRAAIDGLAFWLEREIDRAAARNPKPGRTEPLHRLNRAEYQNAVRDLLHLETDVATLLPADDVSSGFDNIASALTISPTLMDRYLAAAQKIARLALGTPTTVRTSITFDSQTTCGRTTICRGCRSARAAAPAFAIRFRSMANT